MDGFCVSKVCFGDCCNAQNATLAEDGTPCGYNMKGLCISGTCHIDEEFTPEYIAKEQAKEKAYQKLIDKLMTDNEAHAVKKAARWFNSIKKNLNKSGFKKQ